MGWGGGGWLAEALLGRITGMCTYVCMHTSLYIWIGGNSCGADMEFNATSTVPIFPLLSQHLKPTLLLFN